MPTVNHVNPGMIWIILIMNDEACCRQLQQEINRDSRFKCRKYYTSCDVAVLNLAEDNPDVIVMGTDFDAGTPGVNAVNMILRHWPDAKILIVTDNDDDDTIDDAFAFGAFGYILRKEGDINDIYTAIEKVKKGQYHLSPLIQTKYMKHHVLHPGNNPLTDLQTTILALTADGLTMEEIAAQLCLTIHDIKYHYKQIFAKLGVHKMTRAVLKAIYLGIIRIHEFV